MNQLLFRLSQTWIGILLFVEKRKIDLAYWIQSIGGPKVELPPGALEPMFMVGAIMDMEEKFGLKRQTSKACALYQCLIHNDFPDEETRSLATMMYGAENKRRAVYNVMLHYKDIMPHQVNYLFSGDARVGFEEWLDQGAPKNALPQ